VYHIYAIRCARRDALQQQLSQAGIQTGIHYPIPVHLQTAYADSAFPEGRFPQAEAAAREVLSLPMFAELSDAQIDEVVAAVGKGG
jgi:dTDP-4-amino-4,6-dideoxygalactose transaminase